MAFIEIVVLIKLRTVVLGILTGIFIPFLSNIMPIK
jgi:hypothetical protein